MKTSGTNLDIFIQNSLPHSAYLLLHIYVRLSKSIQLLIFKIFSIFKNQNSSKYSFESFHIAVTLFIFFSGVETHVQHFCWTDASTTHISFFFICDVLFQYSSNSFLMIGKLSACSESPIYVATLSIFIFQTILLADYFNCPNCTALILTDYTPVQKLLNFEDSFLKAQCFHEKTVKGKFSQIFNQIHWCFLFWNWTNSWLPRFWSTSTKLGFFSKISEILKNKGKRSEAIS